MSEERDDGGERIQEFRSCRSSGGEKCGAKIEIRGLFAGHTVRICPTGAAAGRRVILQLLNS
jgi:hypothetical protein